VIAYLRDIEDYDWTYTGERPNLERPARVFQEQVEILASFLIDSKIIFRTKLQLLFDIRTIKNLTLRLCYS
jgi:hypothetical protein